MSYLDRCECNSLLRHGRGALDPLNHATTCPALRVLAPAYIEDATGSTVPWTPRLEREKRKRATAKKAAS